MRMGARKTERQWALIGKWRIPEEEVTMQDKKVAPCERSEPEGGGAGTGIHIYAGIIIDDDLTWEPWWAELRKKAKESYQIAMRDAGGDDALPWPARIEAVQIAMAMVLFGAEVLVAAPEWPRMRREADGVQTMWARTIFELWNARASARVLQIEAGFLRPLGAEIEARAIMAGARLPLLPPSHQGLSLIHI